MYQFTTTNVINSAYALDYNGNVLVDGTGANVAKYTGTATALNVAKVGTFKKDGIVSIYKRPYAAGVLEVAELTVTAQTAGDLLRLSILIKQSQATPSEYVNYTLDFQKPVVVEILSSGNASTDAAALVTQLNALKSRFGYNYVNASVNGAKITITAKEHTQRFKEFILSEAVANSNSLTQYDQVTLVTGAVTTAGSVGFGDDVWMQRNIMLPTAENVRYFGISKDERPVLGGNYSEYVLRYQVSKDGTDGIVGGGTSITTHVFYVKSDLVSGFESAISTVGLTVPTVLTAVGVKGTIDVSDGDTDQITVTGAVGAVTFTSNQPTRATVNASGLVTAVGAGAVVITVTDAVGNTDTVSYTVTA